MPSFSFGILILGHIVSTLYASGNTHLQMGFVNGNDFKRMYCILLYASCSGRALTVWMENLAEGAEWLTLFSFCACFFPLGMLQPAVSVADSSGLVSARLRIEINTLDKAIKALLACALLWQRTEGRNKAFDQCQKSDETWRTQEANGITAPICQPSSRPDRSNIARRQSYMEIQKCPYPLHA